MLWILVIGILIFLGFKYPAFGIFSLVCIGIIILVFVIIISSSNHKQEIAKSLISIDQIQLTNLTLNKSSMSYQLSGQVKNNSNYELEDITLAVTAYDCPTNTITSDCITIGQDNNVSTYVNIPSNQVRALNDVTYVNLDNMPPVKGMFLWSYKIVGTIGK